MSDSRRFGDKTKQTNNSYYRKAVFSNLFAALPNIFSCEIYLFNLKLLISFLKWKVTVTDGWTDRWTGGQTTSPYPYAGKIFFCVNFLPFHSLHSLTSFAHFAPGMIIYFEIVWQYSTVDHTDLTQLLHVSEYGPRQRFLHMCITYHRF
jgi:hypothetical protein